MAAEEYVGVPGDVVHAADADLQGCKAGGLPWLWPDIRREALKEATLCEFCGAPRSLVAQIHAPLPAKESPERILLIFVCTTDACSGAPHAFVAIRCQRKPAANQSTPQLQHAHSPAEWGTVTWGATANGSASQPQGLGLEFGDLMAEMDQLVLSGGPSKATVPSEPSAPTQQAAAQKPRTHDDIIVQSTAAVLPEFWIGFRRAGNREGNGGSDEAHIQQLLQQYQQDAATTAEASSSSVSAAGEEYEKSDPHTKFLEKLAQHPSQCVRYGWGMCYTWPTKDVPQPGRCKYCGAAQVPELQVLSPMWHFMLDAATWYDGVWYTAPDRLSTSVLNTPSWDWEVVILFTCSDSCHVGADDVCVAVEEVSAFNLATLPGHICDQGQVERMNAAVSSDAGWSEADAVDTASAAAAAAEEGIDCQAGGAQKEQQTR